MRIETKLDTETKLVTAVC